METKARLLLLTGQPGVGKTTLVTRLVFELRKRGLSVGGIYSREKRVRGTRIGFEMVDLLAGSSEVLADQTGDGPRMGRYRVNLKALAEFAVPALRQASQSADVVVVDEVGPMELLSPEFRRAVSSLVTGPKPCVLVIHRSIRDPLLESIREAPGAELVEVTPVNRDGLVLELDAKLRRMVGL